MCGDVSKKWNLCFSPCFLILFHHLNPSNILPPSYFLSVSYPFTSSPPFLVTNLKEGTESSVCRVPPRLSSTDYWVSTTPQAGTQHCCAVSYPSSFSVIETWTLSKILPALWILAGWYNRVRREGERIRWKGTCWGVCPVLWGTAAEKCGLG